MAAHDRLLKIGPLQDIRWPTRPPPPINTISIHVTPPDYDEDDDGFVPPLRMRRKLSTPVTGLSGAADGLLNSQTKDPNRSPSRSLSPLDRTKRRFSTMVSSAAAAAVSRRLSATIGWCLAAPAHVKPQIVRQGRALCLQYIKTQIRRANIGQNKSLVMKRLKRMIESECGEEATTNVESGVLSGMRALCAALERKRPDAFRHVARQATRAPTAMLRSDTALGELALALARRITRENITWSKIAAVYCICGVLAREAAEVSEGEPSMEVITAPAAAVADLLQDETGNWIAAHGGWPGLVDRLRASDRDLKTEKVLQFLFFFIVGIFFLLVFLRWAVHPSNTSQNIK
ncbi:hypothetical protein O0L34_g1233 [Tuta absoluta]|nr:hypothetical protein O0L34_g1233 [Tuta absoluta]